MDDLAPVRISVISGPNAGLRMELPDGKLVVGRDPACDLRLDDHQLSRQHVVLHRDGPSCEIEDLQSTNGLRVNGIRTTRCRLYDGDMVLVGMTAFTLSGVPGATVVNAPPPLSGVDTFTMDARILFHEWSDQRDLESLVQAKSHLEAVYRFSQTVCRLHRTDHVAVAVLDTLFQELRTADRASVHLVSKDSGALICAVSRTRKDSAAAELPFSSTMARQTINKKHALLSYDAMKDQRFVSGQSIMTQQIHAAICAPMLADDEVLGVIYADSVQEEKRLSQDDLKLVAAMGLIAGTALSHARLVERLEAEKRALEEAHMQLLTTQEHLVQSEKLAVTGRLASGIVHDLKNPMTILKSGIEMLSDDVRKTDTAPIDRAVALDLIDHMERGFEHASAVMENLLSFVRPDRGVREAVDVKEFVADCLRFIQYEAINAKVILQDSVAEDTPAVFVDGKRIKQVMTNLLLNAIQAMDPHRDSSIRVTADVVQSDGKECVRISVTDTGKGMSDEEQERIFEPFFSTKTPGAGTGGTGLGLSISKTLVEQQEGRLWVQSQCGVGTTMHIDLPLAPISQPIAKTPAS